MENSNETRKTKAVNGLRQRLSASAEGTRFHPAHFRNSLLDRDFEPNVIRISDLATRSPHWSFPVVPARAGVAQGQNRDKNWSGSFLIVFILLGATVAVAAAVNVDVAASVDKIAGKVLPVTKRRRKRKTGDKGLPPDDELFRLATTYLEEQFKLWPDVFSSGLLHVVAEDVLRSMVENYKARHKKGKATTAKTWANSIYKDRLGGCYCRYSCDNSSPNSTIDQLVCCLRRAKERNEFIPWDYVFCDYSVSGLDLARRGFASYNSVLEDEAYGIKTTYIDDFTRASRQELEWWRLAAKSRKLGKNMVGASDGFDLRNDDGDLRLAVYGILNRLFIKSLREKIGRGMKGGHRRKTCLGKLPFGFTRKEKAESDGRIVRGVDGNAVHVPWIDPKNADGVRYIFHLFLMEMLSYYEIAKRLNVERLGDWDGWTEGGIKKLLTNPAYIGVFIWNKSRREFDVETEKYVKVRNPRSSWEVWFDRSLAIIPMKDYRKARQRAAQIRGKCPATGKKQSRNQNSATTLFSGTLFCEHCETEVKLNRSANKYKQFGCLNGPAKKHGCTLSASKSVRIVEACLLSYLRTTLISEKVVNELVQKANEHLRLDANKPRTNTKALRARINRLRNQIKGFVRDLADEQHDATRRVLRTQIGEVQTQIERTENEFAEIWRKESPPPPELDAERIRSYLDELSAVLNQAVPASAEAIRKLTGPIRIRQEQNVGRKRGARWIANFSPNFLQFLAHVAKSRNYPDSITLEFLCARKWITTESVEIAIDDGKRQRSTRVEIAELEQQGLCRATIAAKLGVSGGTIQRLSSQRKPPNKNRKEPKRQRSSWSNRAKYREISAEAAHRYRQLGHSIAKIAADFGVCAATVVRALDFANPEILKEAIANGTPPQRSSRSRLSKAEIEQIRKMLIDGVSPHEIVLAVGCSYATVRRYQAKIE